MARVHLARLSGPMGFGRTVAVKRLHDHLLEHPQFVAMFVDEARLASRVRHPNVVSILDVVADGTQLLLVMDYVHAEPLSALLSLAHRRGARVPVPVAVAIVSAMLAGLHAAHIAVDAAGEPLELVHRDISPQNVLVDADGVARISDFGIAKARGRISSTQPGEVKGKLGYMAPEHLEGKPVDRRIDIYAAGVVLWETLTATRLFTGNEGEIVLKIIGSHIEPPGALVDLPAALDAVVMRALSADPAARFQTATEMAVALEAAAPMATQREVAQWVQSLAGDRLATRAQLVAEADRDDDVAQFTDVSPTQPATPPDPTDPVTASLARRAPSVPRAGTLLAATVLLATVALVSFSSLSGSTRAAWLEAKCGPALARATAAAASVPIVETASPAPPAASESTAAPTATAHGKTPRPPVAFDKKKLYGRE